jgi:hypothetical protein
MTLIDTILTAAVMLLGTEGEDYLSFERDAEEWQLVSWVHKN